jgi:hypothetical protein
MAGGTSLKLMRIDCCSFVHGQRLCNSLQATIPLVFDLQMLPYKNTNTLFFVETVRQHYQEFSRAVLKL